MPLVGIIDPSHDERKKTKPGRWPFWLPVEDVLGEAMVANPRWSPWTYETIKSAMDQWQERDYLSVTALVGGCMRGTVIERKEPFIEALDNLYASWRGTNFHKSMEKNARDGSIAEWRFWTTIDGQEISCSPDLITYDTVWDYKTTENPPQNDYMRPSHKEQLQANRFVFNNAERWVNAAGEEDDIPMDPRATVIRHLAIVYLGPKWPKVIETLKTIEVPNTSGKGKHKSRRPDVWSDKDVVEMLRPRMDAWFRAMDSYPEWPEGLEDEPGWAGGATWRCPGPPICHLPNCMAKRWPDAIYWENR